MFTLAPSTVAPRTYALWGLVLLLGLLERHDLVQPPPVDTSSEGQREREREQALQQRRQLGNRICTMVGCRSGAGISLRLPRSLHKKSTMVRVCLIGVCAEGPLPSGDPRSDCNFLPGLFSRCSLDLRGPEPVLYLFAANGEPKDGDIYSVRVYDPTRKVKNRVFVKEAVQYSGRYPNGPRCGVACYTASINH